jgi:Ca2+-dependent lipid-binding protein
MDIITGSSDPYCDIKCNGTNLQTSVKRSTLSPQFHENFEIDVTNPEAKLNIVVRDKDYFGADDFMGQIELSLRDFIDERNYHATYQLKGEDLAQPDDDFDRGEIEIRQATVPIIMQCTQP